MSSKRTQKRKKNAFFRFFEQVYNKFPKLVLLNLLYVLCILPLLCGGVAFLAGFFHISPELVEKVLALKIIMKLVLWIPRPIGIVLFVLSALLYGPITCGFRFVLRNFATGSHAWISDLFSRAKSNWKQGLVLGLIDLILILCVCLYQKMDLGAVAGQGISYFYQVLKYASVVVAIFYFLMRYYTYNIAVTVELPLKDIFKNAAIFVVLGFFRNLLATVAIVATVFAFTSTSIVDVVLISTFLFSFSEFIGVFTTYPVIQQYMLPKTEEKDEREEEDAD